MRRALLALVLLAAAPPLWAQEGGAPPPKPEDVYGIDSVNYDERTQQVRVEGRTVLPDGAVLIASFIRSGNPAGYARTTVNAQKFSLVFDAHGSTFFPGTYAVQVEYRPQDQEPRVLEQVGGEGVTVAPLVHEIDIGTKEEQKAFDDQVKKKLLDIMRELGRLYVEMNQYGGFTIASAAAIERKHKGTLPEEDRKRLFKEIDKFTTTNWEPRFRAANLDFSQYREEVAGGALPNVEKDIDSLIIVLTKWYAAFWGDIAKRLKIDPPDRVAGVAAFPRYELEPQVEEFVFRIYQTLGVKSPAEKEVWTVASPTNPERGRLDGLTYTSYASKFRISMPSKQWKLDFGVINPSVRVRILPMNDEEAKKVAIAVEIRDFPEAKGVEDLNKICEVFNSERWGGYKRASGKAIQASDATMPGGVRPGYEIVCFSETQEGKFKVRDYALYCRWLKRTYSVLCIADRDWFENYATDFQTVCKSFAILDDPNFLEKAKKEEEEAEKAEKTAHPEGGEGQK